MLIKYCSLGFLGKVKHLTCVGKTSSVSDAEDASNNAEVPESGRASCGVIDGSCIALGVC